MHIVGSTAQPDEQFMRQVTRTLTGTGDGVLADHPVLISDRDAKWSAAVLEHDEHRDAARQALRGFLEKIVIPPGDGLLRVVGNLGAMLAAAQGQRGSASNAVGYVGCGGSQPTLSAAVATGGLKRARART